MRLTLVPSQVLRFLNQPENPATKAAQWATKAFAAVEKRLSRSAESGARVQLLEVKPHEPLATKPDFLFQLLIQLNGRMAKDKTAHPYRIIGITKASADSSLGFGRGLDGQHDFLYGTLIKRGELVPLLTRSPGKGFLQIAGPESPPVPVRTEVCKGPGFRLIFPLPEGAAAEGRARDIVSALCSAMTSEDIGLEHGNLSSTVTMEPAPQLCVEHPTCHPDALAAWATALEAMQLELNL